jgi:hypothetical protein
LTAGDSWTSIKIKAMKGYPALELPVMSRAGIPTVKRATEEISLKVAAVML